MKRMVDWQVRLVSTGLLLILGGRSGLAFAGREGALDQAPGASSVQGQIPPANNSAESSTDAESTSGGTAELPDSPSAARSQSASPAPQPGGQQPQSSQPSPPPSVAQKPVGTAAAEITPTRGSGASNPAGVAIAPAKQHQVRSLFIKIGAVVGAGAALGTVMALSMASPSKPPGAR
jgi:hypothetical protein